MKGSFKWLVFGVAVMLFGASCADDDFFAEISKIEVDGSTVLVMVDHDDAQGAVRSGTTFGVEFCPKIGSGCFYGTPVDTFDLRGSTKTIGEFRWDRGPGEFRAQVVAFDSDGDVFDESGVYMPFTVPDEDSNAAEQEDGDETASEAPVDATTTTAATTTTSTSTSSSTTSTTTTTTVKAAPATTTPSATTTTVRATTTTTVPTSTTTSTSTTSTSTTSSTTTTTEYPDWSTTSTSLAWSGVGEWIENDLSTCAYRGTMGCGIYRGSNPWYVDYGPVGQAGDMMTSYWGPAGDIAYSTYSGHSYIDCNNNGSGGCGWYYTATRGTYEMGYPVP